MNCKNILTDTLSLLAISFILAQIIHSQTKSFKPWTSRNIITVKAKSQIVEHFPQICDSVKLKLLQCPISLFQFIDSLVAPNKQTVITMRTQLISIAVSCDPN